MKYKIVITEGCTAFDFTVNDKSIADLTAEEQSEFVNYLCEQFKSQLQGSTVRLEDLVRVFQSSDWGSDRHNCDQCGDTVHWTSWEL